MKTRQLLSILVCTLVQWTIGNALTPILPLYIRESGAGESLAGYYMSFAILCLALGTLTAGWPSDRYQRRRLPVIVCGLWCAPVTVLIGTCGRLWQLLLLTGLSWFFGGVIVAATNILAGLFASEDRPDRGHGRGELSSGGNCCADA